MQSRQRQCGSGVAPSGLEDEGRRTHADLGQLVPHQEPMLVVANDAQRHFIRLRLLAQREKTSCRLLKQCSLPHKSEKLLRVKRPRKRPQPCAGAASHDHREDGQHIRGDCPGGRQKSGMGWPVRLLGLTEGVVGQRSRFDEHFEASVRAGFVGMIVRSLPRAGVCVASRLSL